MGGVQSEEMGGVGSKKRKSSEAKVTIIIKKRVLEKIRILSNLLYPTLDLNSYNSINCFARRKVEKVFDQIGIYL